MESVKFGELCGILEKISTCTKPKKLKILNNLINSAREIDAPQVRPAFISLFPVSWELSQVTYSRIIFMAEYLILLSCAFAAPCP